LAYPPGEYRSPCLVKIFARLDRLPYQVPSYLPVFRPAWPARETIMNTLTSEPVASLVARLYAEAESSDARLWQIRERMSPEEQADMRTTTRYREMYGAMKEFYLAVPPETAGLLYMLARGMRARSIVEFGTSFGISTLHMAAALRDNGGGRVIGSEFEHGKVLASRQNLEVAGLSDLVEIREGDALETLSRELPETIDLVLLDGAKGLYLQVLSLLEGHLRPGALIVADNADHCPEYVAHVRRPEAGYLSVPIGGNVEISMRS
jgi:predicted O-methyltransferase YrrM